MRVNQMPHAGAVLLTVLLAVCGPSPILSLGPHMPACHLGVTLRGSSIDQDGETVLCSSAVTEAAAHASTGGSEATFMFSSSTTTESSSDFDPDSEVLLPQDSLPRCRSKQCSATGQCTHKGHVCACQCGGVGCSRSFSYSCAWTG